MTFGFTKDAQAFEDLVTPYSPMVYRHCYQMLKNTHEAEDATQETMLRAYRAYHRFSNQGVATWLYQIAHRVCLDILKSARVRRERLLYDQHTETYGEPSSEEPTPEESYLRNESNQALQNAMQTLSTTEQVLLSLFYGQGCSYDELSKATGLAQGTVKSKLSRAKQKLKVVMEKEQKNED